MEKIAKTFITREDGVVEITVRNMETGAEVQAWLYDDEKYGCVMETELGWCSCVKLTAVADFNAVMEKLVDFIIK